MGKTILFTISFLLFADALLGQESPLQLFVVDSIVLMDGAGFPIRNADTIEIFSASAGTLHRYSMDGALFERVQFDSAFCKKGIWQFQHGLIAMTAGKIMLIHLQESEFLFFDHKGKFLYKRRLQKKFNGAKYHAFSARFPPYSMELNPYRGTVLISVYRQDKKFSLKNPGYMRGWLKHYETPGIVAEYNLNGKILNVFGRYDTIYRQGKWYDYLRNYKTGYLGRDSVFLSFQLGDKVAIYEKGQEKKAIGRRGVYFNKDPKDYFGMTTREQFCEDNPKYMIETPFYLDCAMIETRGMVRTYTQAIPDTVQFTPKEIAIKEKFRRGEIKGCLRKTAHDEAQANQLFDKPWFVQIFYLPLPHQPMYEGPIPVKMPLCLGLRSDHSFLFCSLYPEKIGKTFKRVIYCIKMESKIQW